MGVHISDDKSVVSTAHKTFHFDLSKDVYNDLKHEICSEAQKSVLNLSYRLHLKSSNKHVALKTCLFITSGKNEHNSTKTINSK